MAEVLAQQGVRVVGFSTLRYFWQTRAPAGGGRRARPRHRPLRAARAPTARFVVVGYSLQGEPGTGGGQPPAVGGARAGGGAGPDLAGCGCGVRDQVGDWFGSAPHEGSSPIAPEVLRSPVPVYCVHGEDGDDSACAQLDSSHVRC